MYDIEILGEIQPTSAGLNVVACVSLSPEGPQVNLKEVQLFICSLHMVRECGTQPQAPHLQDVLQLPKADRCVFLPVSLHGLLAAVLEIKLVPWHLFKL